MQFSSALLTLVSVALATAAPTAGNQSTVTDVPVMGEWRPTFTTTDQPQTNCNVESPTKIQYDLAKLDECQNLAFNFRNRHGYYTLSGWAKESPVKLTSWGTCQVYVSNVDNANTVYVGNQDLADMMDAIFKLRGDDQTGGHDFLGCKQARLGLIVGAINQ
ncbi:hypothetical protein LQW54_006164 [Pestalotiopsis sp. IQ-011]